MYFEIGFWHSGIALCLIILYAFVRAIKHTYYFVTGTKSSEMSLANDILHFLIGDYHVAPDTPEETIGGSFIFSVMILVFFCGLWPIMDLAIIWLGITFFLKYLYERNKENEQTRKDS